MLEEVGVVKIEVTVGRVLVLEVCEAFVLLVVELELEDVEDVELILLVEVLPSLCDRL